MTTEKEMRKRHRISPHERASVLRQSPDTQIASFRSTYSKGYCNARSDPNRPIYQREKRNFSTFCDLKETKKKKNWNSKLRINAS